MFQPEEIIEAQAYSRLAVARILSNTKPNEVEDVLQNAAIKALRGREGFRGDASFRVWFMRIAMNEAYMAVRGKTKLVGEETLVFRPSVEPSPESLAIASEAKDILKQEGESLRPALREEFREALLEVSPVGARRKARRFRMRNQLRRRLEQRGVRCCV